MSTILLAYGTTEGHTARIAEVVAQSLRERGHDVVTADLRTAHVAVPDGCAGVVVGASIHMAKHDRHAVDFAQRNVAALAALPSAFFSVSLAAHGDVREARGYVEDFERETGWRPALTATFAGALQYSRYGFLKRRFMRRIAMTKPGDLGTDASRDYTYTDWDAVRRFAEEFGVMLAAPVH